MSSHPISPPFRWLTISGSCAATAGRSSASWLGCVVATLIVSARLTPIYESTVTVDIDRQMPSAVIGQDATRAPANDADQFLATQVKLIQSDSVLRPVAEQYHLLDIEKQGFAKSRLRRRRSPHPAEEAQGHAAAQHLSVC